MVIMVNLRLFITGGGDNNDDDDKDEDDENDDDAEEENLVSSSLRLTTATRSAVQPAPCASSWLFSIKMCCW